MNRFRCDWCNKDFVMDAPCFKHLCEINKPEPRIGDMGEVLQLPREDHIMILYPLPRIPIPNET